MYTLRIIKKDDTRQVFNQFIGENYSVVSREIEASKKKKDIEISNANVSYDWDFLEKKYSLDKSILAVLVANNGKYIHPMTRREEYFIVGPTGKTFDNLTL